MPVASGAGSSLQIHIHNYSGHRNVEVDAKVFSEVTGYNVTKWSDNNPIQVVEIEKEKGSSEEDILKMIERMIYDVCRSDNFTGWMAYPDHSVSPLYYTPLLELELQEVKFSSMITPFELKAHAVLAATPGSPIYAMFEHDIGRLVIYVCKSSLWQKISVHYDELENHIVQQHGDDVVRMVLFLKNCPSFWELDPESVRKKRAKLRSQGHYNERSLENQVRMKAPWSRVRTLTEDTTPTDPSGPHIPHIPRCSAIELTYPAKDSCISRLISGFKKHQFQCFFTRFEDLRNAETGGEEDRSIETGTWMKDLIDTRTFLSNNINFIYALKCLESLGYQFLDKLYKTSPHYKKSFFRFLKERLWESQEDGIERITQTLYKLVQGFEKDPFLDPCAVFELYSNKVVVRECDPRSHYQYIKRIIVTPSRYLFVPPEPIAINRVLRAHIEYVDNFARVCFRDEDFSQFNVHSDKATLNVWNVINEGVSIADDITFRFLGCSNSQLRSQGLWLFYPQCPHSVETIRSKIGDLSSMKTIQKYVTRMGLAFTATDFSLSEPVEVEHIPEQEMRVGNKKFTFSDGVGCISPAVQELIIREKFGLDTCEVRPVAFQIRLGGCKGMVAVNPELGDRLVVQIRPSMKKFSSEDKRLEPCGYSAPRELHMNRQVIAILRAQGVPDENFIFLQNRSLIELAEMLTNERLAAIEMSTMLGMKVSELTGSGIRITTEPFLRRKLISLYKFKIRDAITKTRFRIDHRKGRQMKGVMDETGTLEYGQVFCQYSDLTDPSMERRIVLKGDLFVTKNPCLHPGDLQRMEAVDVPALRHLYDVVVFPGQGKRPHPNEMSGSDLDGDEYFVCWEESLMPRLDMAPAEYYIEVVDDSALDHIPPELSEEKINTFVYDYITKGSKLGQISNAHAIWADKLAKGVDSDMCRKLAKKHSDAVDFIKTGVAPQFDFSERSLDYPDWMLKPDKTAYHSKTAIGQMFHVVEGLDHHILHRKVGDEGIRPSPLFTLSTPPTDRELVVATRHYTDYCTDLANIMAAYGIEEEGDLAAGYLNSIKMSLAKEHERNYDMREQCLAMFRALQKKTRRAFYREVGVSHAGWRAREEEVVRQAAAWYWVTYNNPPTHQDYSLLSFPWCVSDILIKIPELMMTSRESVSVEVVLQDRVGAWYEKRRREGEPVGDQVDEMVSHLVSLSQGRLKDASRHQYGQIAGPAMLLYTAEQGKPFPWISPEMLRAERPWVRELVRASKDRSPLITVPAEGQFKLLLTRDEGTWRKVQLLGEYCKKYDRVGHAVYLAICWAERAGLAGPEQEPDIGMSLVEFMVQQGHINLLRAKGPADPVQIGKRPRRKTATFYIGYLKWVIRGLKPAPEEGLPEEMVARARAILTSPKSLKAAMRELHCICYTLSFETSDTHQELSIRRKSEKKRCYTIAKATSFCNTFFGDPATARQLARGGKPLDIKIREAELGGLSALILEMWGDSPQLMNEVADALHINEDKFQLTGNFLFVKHPGYRQLAYIAPASSAGKQVDEYTSVRKLEADDKGRSVLHHIRPIYYGRDPEIRGILEREVEARVQLMRDVPLYDPISHGEITLRAHFGSLSLKKTEGGQFEKRYICVPKERSSIRDAIKKHFLKVAKPRKPSVVYTVHVVFEGLRYKMVFNSDQELQSLSLEEILWADIMVSRPEGDVNLTITSTHSLGGEKLRHLPLTHAIANAPKGKVWFCKDAEKLGVRREGDEFPCYIARIEVAKEWVHVQEKDGRFPFALHEREVEMFVRRTDAELTRSRCYTEVFLVGNVRSLAHIEDFRNFHQMTTDLMSPGRKTIAAAAARARRASGRGRGVAASTPDTTPFPSSIASLSSSLAPLSLPPTQQIRGLEEGIYSSCQREQQRSGSVEVIRSISNSTSVQDQEAAAGGDSSGPEVEIVGEMSTPTAVTAPELPPENLRPLWDRVDPQSLEEACILLAQAPSLS